MGNKRAVPFEEAKRCSKCGNPGEEGKTVPVVGGRVDRGTKVVYIWCRTVLCPWYNTTWPVQVEPNGTVYEHDHSADGKEFTMLKNFDERSAQLEQSLTAQLAAETRGDGEVRGR